MSFLLIAPYPDLAQIASSVVSAEKADCLVCQGNLQKAVEMTRDYIRQGHDIDLLISRGGTATLLSRVSELPVVEIRVTGYDLLRAIQPHASLKRRIAIIGYDNVVSGARSIGEILEQSFGYFAVGSNRDVRSAVHRAREWGAEVVVGDAVSVTFARHAGMETELVQSGAESIRQALNEAVTMSDSIRDQLSRTRRLNALVDHIEEGVLFLTADDRISQANTMAAELLRTPMKKLVGGVAVRHGVLPESVHNVIFGDSHSSGILQHGGRTLFVQRTDITVGMDRMGSAVLIRDVGRIQELEARIRKELSRKGLVASYTFKQMIGTAPVFLRSVQRARQCSKTNSTILISGETGTGKEVFAQSIHNASSRRNGPFVAVNCAALPDSLLESELFGYVEGAFTGARKGGKKGLFELAHAGTIFLDEINEMNISLQARFLRVLQEKQIMKIGDDSVIDVDVRFITASNRDLHAETSAGRFRSDLFYRIKILDVRIPPLRDRYEDIRPLVEHFVRDFSEQYGLPEPPITDRLVNRLLAHRWPGNIRELRNLAEKLVVLSAIAESEDVLIDEVTEDLSVNSLPSAPVFGSRVTLAEIEYSHILAVLEEEGHNVTQTARVLGIDRTTLRRKLQRGG